MSFSGCIVKFKKVSEPDDVCSDCKMLVENLYNVEQHHRAHGYGKRQFLGVKIYRICKKCCEELRDHIKVRAACNFEWEG